MKIKRGIKYKTISSVVLVVSICIGLLGGGVYLYFRNMLMEDALAEAGEKVKDIVYQLELIEQQMEIITDYIITDRDVTKYIEINPNETVKDRNNVAYEMSQILTRFVVLNEYLSGICLVRSDGWVFSSNSALDSKYLQPYVEKILKTEKVSEEHNRFFSSPHEVYTNASIKSSKSLSFVVQFRPLDKIGEIDYLILDIPYSKLEEIAQQGGMAFDNIQIYNYKNEILYREEQTDSAYQNFIVNESASVYDDGGRVMIKEIAHNGQWKAAVVIGKARLFNQITVVLMWFALAAFFTACVIIFVLARLMTSITRPVERLSEAMNKVAQGDYNIHVQVTSRDEIEELANVFNGMLIQIQDYIEATVQNERTKQKLKLELLMNQINPHFIYNTLNSIIYIAHEKQTEGVTEITQSLINILRDSVKIGKHAIVDYVQVEIDIIQNYMNIQKYRYPERFIFCLECEADLKSLEIPKMIIQPLVENALFHGICLQEEVGTITVRIKTVYLGGEPWVEIDVEDNGVGMTEEIKACCFKEKKEYNRTNQTRSIGLCNIKERLHFNYKEHCFLEIWSEVEKGTRVRIGFPKKQ